MRMVSKGSKSIAYRVSRIEYTGEERRKTEYTHMRRMEVNARRPGRPVSDQKFKRMLWGYWKTSMPVVRW